MTQFSDRLQVLSKKIAASQINPRPFAYRNRTLHCDGADLNALAAHQLDRRHATAREDIGRHRLANDDWDDAWVFSDPRFQLADGPDQVLLDCLQRCFDLASTLARATSLARVPHDCPEGQLRLTRPKAFCAPSLLPCAESRAQSIFRQLTFVPAPLNSQGKA